MSSFISESNSQIIKLDPILETIQERSVMWENGHTNKYKGKNNVKKNYDGPKQHVN